MKRLPKDVLKWAAAAFALVATATAEYELARAIGMNQWVAAAVPGALDAYVVRALRAHREVLTAVIAMVAVNAASHLVSAGVLKVEWPLITAVSAIAPLVLWRVHALGTPGTSAEHTSTELDDTEHDDVLASTEPEHGRAPDNPEPPGTREHPEHSVHSIWDLDSDGAQRVLDAVHSEHTAEHASTDDWMDVHDAVHAPSTPPVPVHAPYNDHVQPIQLTKPMRARHLSLVEHTSTEPEHTSTEPEHTRTADDWNLEHVSTRVLDPEDVEHMDRARELFHTTGSVPTFRALKEGTPGMGTPRAKRIRAALKAEAEGAV